MNPFTCDMLSQPELDRDCLNYLSVSGKPVKASRLFLGNELSHQIGVLNKLFDRDADYYKSIELNKSFFRAMQEGVVKNLYYPETINNRPLTQDVFSLSSWDPAVCSSYEEAYHQVIWGLVRMQVASVRLAAGSSPITKILVDGGFVDNEIFITLLKHFLPEYTIEASEMPLGSAFGAASVLEADFAQRMTNDA